MSQACPKVQTQTASARAPGNICVTAESVFWAISVIPTSLEGTGSVDIEVGESGVRKVGGLRSLATEQLVR